MVLIEGWSWCLMQLKTILELYRLIVLIMCAVCCRHLYKINRCFNWSLFIRLKYVIFIFTFVLFHWIATWISITLFISQQRIFNRVTLQRPVHNRRVLPLPHRIRQANTWRHLNALINIIKNSTLLIYLKRHLFNFWRSR